MKEFFYQTFTNPIIITVLSLQIIWMLYAISELFKLRNKVVRRNINYYSFESIPSTFVTIGLFGTCLGIAIGLYEFDITPESIKSSVKTLLDGLKSAFFVTIFGLFLSLIFKNIINYALNRYADIQPPESPELNELKEMNKNLAQMGKSISDSFGKKFDVFIYEMKIMNEKMIANLDSFASTLAEHNQEALIEALEGVVNELNTTFKDTLGSLVKQNFQTLTESVDNLNTWQYQNKEIMVTLTTRFTTIVTNTEKLNKSLSGIIEKNDQLIGQNSKLNQIIDGLSKVIVDDVRFVKIINQLNQSTENLSSAANNYNMNLEEIRKLSNSIDTWFKGEHSIKESILLLQQQLNELAKIRVDQIPVFTDSLRQTFGTLDKILSEYQKSIPRLIERAIDNRNEN
jgi:uncharacterized phage infection (PIP) family protein YhgE